MNDLTTIVSLRDWESRCLAVSLADEGIELSAADFTNYGCAAKFLALMDTRDDLGKTLVGETFYERYVENLTGRFGNLLADLSAGRTPKSLEDVLKD